MLPINQQIIYDLDKMRNGANAHTINKAIYYIRIFHKEEREKLYEEHLENCQKTIATKDVRELKKSMRWWL